MFILILENIDCRGARNACYRSQRYDPALTQVTASDLGVHPTGGSHDSVEVLWRRLAWVAGRQRHRWLSGSAAADVFHQLVC